MLINLSRIVHADPCFDYKSDTAPTEWVNYMSHGQGETQHKSTGINARGSSRYAPNKMFFAGASLSYSLRNGRYSLSGSRSFQVTKNSITMWGLTLGKNFPFFFHFRLHFPISFDYGSSVEDTVNEVPLDDGTVQTLLLKASYYHAGFTPELQIPFRITPDFALFLAGGGGIHYMRYVEDEFLAENERVHVIDSYLQRGHSLCFSAAGGIGIEILVNNTFAVSLQYSFRYWNPVRIKTTMDLFPYQPIIYKETHLTHIFKLMLLR